MKFISEKLSHVPSKQVWLGIIFAISGTGLWVFLYFSFAARATNSFVISLLFLFGIFWTIVYALIVLFSDKKFAHYLYAYTFIVISVLFAFHGLNILGIVLFGVFVALAQARAEKFKTLLVEFKPLFLSRKFLPIFFTGFAIFLAFTYNSFILSYYAEDPHVSEDVYSVAFRPVDISLQFIVSGYESGMSVSEFQEILLNTFVAQFLPAELIPEEPEVPSGFFGEDTGEQTLERFTLNWINATIRTTLTPYTEFLSALFILGLFLVFKFLMWPIKWVCIGLTLLAIKILLFYNIIVLRKIEKIQEIPVLE